MLACVCLRPILQILRRTIEVENNGIKSPAVQWQEEDWNEFHDAVVAMQDNLCRLGVVRLICVLLGNRCERACWEPAVCCLPLLFPAPPELCSTDVHPCIRGHRAISCTWQPFHGFVCFTIPQ